MSGVPVQTVTSLYKEAEGNWIAIAARRDANGWPRPDREPWTAKPLFDAWNMAGGGC